MVYLFINQLTAKLSDIIDTSVLCKGDILEECGWDKEITEDGIELNYYCRTNLKTSKKVIEILEQNGYKLIKDKGLIKIFVKNPLIV
jgi:hypothetical protein